MLIGLVLAGGQSRRMGQDKALMCYKGNTLIDRATSLLQSAKCSEIMVSRNEPGFLNDKIQDVGPLGGVHAALHALCPSNSFFELLVLPVDMPQMTPQFLTQLVSSGREHNAACYVENRFLPFYLPVTQATENALNSYLVKEKKRRVVGFLEEVGAAALQEKSGQSSAHWLNVNAPSDWPHDR
ncbi:molybdenum cofactor guanylyltransferase [Alteromonas gracilis]|uniref:molybdenum cofactor guanylyltransferase n=1 Tax=Alteromonas gracilis TaxID=1479524 RepID=UPI003735EA39